MVPNMNINKTLLDFIDRLKYKLYFVLSSFATAILLFVIFYIIFLAIKPLILAEVDAEIVNFFETLQQNNFEENKKEIKSFFNQYGSYANLVFVGIQILQVVIAPIPGQLMGTLGGFIFGFWYGLLLTMIGLTIGSFIAIYFSRIIGNKFVRRFVPKPLMEEFDDLIKHGGVLNFFMVFLLPALPDDAVCFMAGLTKLKIWKLIIACILGRLPGMAVLAFVGSSLESDLFVAKIVFSIAMVFAFFIWIYDDIFTKIIKSKITQAR